MENEIILKIFANRFTSLVKDSNTDIDKLAEKLGIKSKSTIYRYMNAEMAPKIPTVKFIAEIFGVNPLWLMGYNVSKEEPNFKFASNNALDIEGLDEQDIKELQEFIQFKKNLKKNKMEK